MELSKSCSKCKEEKPHSEFRRCKKGDKYGLHSWCYDCNRAARRQNYVDNKEKYQQWYQDWSANNPDKIKEYEVNRVRTYTYQDWISLPGRREQKKAYDQNYRAKKVNAEGVLSADVIAMVFETYGKRCLQCGTTDNIEIDHVVALSNGGTNLFDNLQPLCKSHNSSKGNRNSTDFRQGDGRTTP